MEYYIKMPTRRCCRLLAELIGSSRGWVYRALCADPAAENVRRRIAAAVCMSDAIDLGLKDQWETEKAKHDARQILFPTRC